MQREKVKRSYEQRRFNKSNIEGNIGFNRKIVLSIIIFIIILVIKFLPVSTASRIINSIAKTDTDYPAMIAEIKEIIRKHTVGNKYFIMPIEGEIMSGFGQRQDPITFETSNHTGIDINAPENTKVHAAFDGEVFRVEENEYYGKFIMIKHKDNMQTLYAHLNGYLKTIGDTVKSGEEIALSGNSGRSTGSHLHFEIRINNSPVDPQLYLSK